MRIYLRFGRSREWRIDEVVWEGRRFPTLTGSTIFQLTPVVPVVRALRIHGRLVVGLVDGFLRGRRVRFGRVIDDHWVHRGSGPSTAARHVRMLELCLMLRILTIALHAVWTLLPIVDLVVIGVVRMTVVVLVIGIPPAKFKGFVLLVKSEILIEH